MPIRLPFIRKPVEAAAAPAAVATEQHVAVLFGATWLPLPPVDSGQEDSAAATLARDSKGSHYAVVYGASEIVVGAARGKFSANTRLAAQLLSSVVGAERICYLSAVDQVYPNDLKASTLLFVGAYLHGQWAVCACLNGLPVLDFVGTPEEALKRAQDFASRLVNGGSLLISNEIEADCATLKRAAPASVRIVDGLPFDARWAISTQALKPVGIARARLALVGVAAFVLTAPALWYSYRNVLEKRAQREFDAAQNLRQAAAMADLERLQLEAARQQPLVQVAPAARMIFEFASALRDSRAGFQLDKVVFTPKTSNLNFSRADKNATFSDFVTVADSLANTPTFDVSKLDVASVAYKPLGWTEAPQIDLKQPLEAGPILLRMSSLAQQSDILGIKLSVTPPQPLLTTEQLSRVERNLLPKLARKAGTWSAQGPSDLLIPLVEAMPASTCTLTEIEFKLGKDSKGNPADSFVAKGRYFSSWT